jgi:hypothetical protein
MKGTITGFLLFVGFFMGIYSPFVNANNQTDYVLPKKGLGVCPVGSEFSFMGPEERDGITTIPGICKLGNQLDIKSQRVIFNRIRRENPQVKVLKIGQVIRPRFGNELLYNEYIIGQDVLLPLQQ